MFEVRKHYDPHFTQSQFPAFFEALDSKQQKIIEEQHFIHFNENYDKYMNQIKKLASKSFV